MASSSVVLKAAGLVTSPNLLERPDGAMITASNIVIRRDGVIEQRRGFALFGDQLPSSADTVKQLGVYRGRILRHYSSSLQYDSSGDGDFETYTGNVTETEDGLRIKFTESNGNLYFTTAQGIKKLSAANASQLSTINPVLAGAVKALDLSADTIFTQYSQSGFFPQDSVVAYRVVWNKKDNNQNLITGTPSERAVVYNPMLPLMLRDFAQILTTLDNLENSSASTARISDRNYVSSLLLNLSASASEFRSNLMGLASKLDNDILLANTSTAPLVMSGANIDTGICTITFSSGNPTDYLSAADTIRLAGFSLSTQNEIQTLTFSAAPTAGQFTLRSGTHESGVLNWNDNATTIQTALRLLEGNQNVTVTGTISGGLTLTYITADGDMPQVELGATNTLNASGTPVTMTGATTQQGFSSTSGSLNDVQTITSLTSNTIVFNTTAQGSVSVASGTINSNFFREIPEPTAPLVPPTNDDLLILQDYLQSIIDMLQDLPDAIIEAGADQDSVAELDITTTTTVSLTFTVPEEVSNDDTYFYQVYRSQMASATGATALEDISPNDELRIVYEDYPTEAELEAGSITITDITPDDFLGANLYTNSSSGEGITSANDQPPMAKDINRYRNSTFYANTKTKQRLSLNMIGVQQMIDDFDNLGIDPKLTITNGDVTNTYKFVTGQQEITLVQTVADVADSLNGKYFLVNTPSVNYYIWYNTTGGVDPAVSGRTGIEVNITTGDSANTVAQKTYERLAIELDAFVVEVNTNEVTIINTDVGYVNESLDVDTGFAIVRTQDGRGEKILPQITVITAIPGSDFVSSGTADYFKISSAFNQSRFLVWFNKGTVTEPSESGYTNTEIMIDGTETASQVADKIAAVLPTTRFACVNNSGVLTVTNVQSGEANQATDDVLDPVFTIVTTQDGAIEVLLSPQVSPAQAVDETARSLCRVINRNDGESIYAFYLSGAFDIPGKILFESRNLTSQNVVYVIGNNDNTGGSFNPNVSPEFQISDIATGSSTSVITTTTDHGMSTGDTVVLGATDSQPIVDGVYEVTVLSSTTFSIPTFVSIAGTMGAGGRASIILASENEEKPNRVYYSKTSQPEAVPIINYFDVGSQDKAILRIVPLRDSLFVFKEDGLFRISGDTAPFQLELFDNSFIVVAPDSVAVANNAIYAWTTQGIQQLTEGGTPGVPISRNIDNIILKTQSYDNFSTVTWGIGYESDNAYIVFTANKKADTEATIAYRYSTLTQTWTTYDKSSSCGVINNSNDKLYLGCTDVAYIEQERKNFDRTDYADREYETVIGSNSILNYQITLPSVLDYSIGDVFVQNQTMTIYDYNMLLKKLDLDTGVGDSDYFDTLEMVRGDSPRNKLEALAQKLDADPNITQTDFETSIASLNGTIASNTMAAVTVITDNAHGLITGRMIRISGSNCVPSIDGEHQVTVLSANTFSIPVEVTTAGTAGTWETLDTNFEDIKTCFNKITSMLNADLTINFANYKTLTNDTIQEAIIVDINTITRKVTVNLALDFVVGAATVYKAITSTFTYSPNTMGDPLMLKHLSESTLMFETRNITSGILSFATDLLPEFIDIEFDLDGNGIFGHTPFGEGNFGGLASSAPFRTYIPRQCQRCRYIVAKFEHSTAREDYRVVGLTITGNIGQSTRAFR